MRRYLFTNTLTAGRGCPWRCAFCYNSSPNLDARHRMKSVPQVLAEIRALRTRHVMFIDDNLEHYNTSRCVFHPKHMTPDELEQGYRWIYERFYSWEGIWRRLPSDRGQMAAYLQFNLLYRKFGHFTSRLGLAFGMRRLARVATWLAYGRGACGRRNCSRVAKRCWSPVAGR